MSNLEKMEAPSAIGILISRDHQHHYYHLVHWLGGEQQCRSPPSFHSSIENRMQISLGGCHGNNNFSLYCPGNRSDVRSIYGYRQSHSCRRSGPRLPPRRSNDHRCSHSHRVAANRNSRGVKTADVSSAEGIEAIVSAVTHIVGRQPWQTSSSYRPFRRPLDPRAKCSEPTDFRRSLTSRRRACWVVATDRAG